MKAKRLLTIAGVIFLNLLLVAIVLEAVDLGEGTVSRSLVAQEIYDFGDAPADRYPTLLADNGARHTPGEHWLGNPPDLERDGQPHPASLGDDNDGNDDEDGVLFLSPLVAGNTASVSVIASFEGWLNAWLDFHNNGSWADPGDQIFTDQQLVPGPNNLTFSVPADAVPGPTFSRWRFSGQPGLTYETGSEVPEGEVEDHWVEIYGLPPVDSWEKWINGIPWASPGITITVETSDTIQVVDVIRTERGTPFLLTEIWDPGRLNLSGFAIDPPIPAQPEIGDGIFAWDVPPDHPEVLVLTKWFHVEPCTWDVTLLEEFLDMPGVQDPVRPITFEKRPPKLEIDALYQPEVLSGEPAWFTLVYSNTGGYENNVSIRNDFPPQAPYVGSDPQATWQDPEGSWAEWDLGDLAMGDEGSIVVEVEIVPRLQPSTTVNITDYIRNHLGDAADWVEITFHVTGTEEYLFDLGDAPDSTNHAGLPMLTYAGPSSPGVPGSFPTVFDPATGLPEGPLHLQPLADAWLGQWVTLEYDADLLPDQDGVPNLDPPPNMPDQDGADDGVTLPVDLTDCVPTFITYTVTITPGASPLDRFVNVWLDWNRDADWDDILTCAVDGDAPEWAVQNQPLPALPPGPHLFATPVFVPFNKAPDQPIWMRISIAEQPATTPPDGSLPDGRGPANGYAFGETEDYYLPPQELPPGRWEKWIDEQLWRPDVVYTVETSDTVKVVDVIHTSPDAPFSLSELWDPTHLVLLEHDIVPPLPIEPIIGDGLFLLDVPGDHPEVITVTKFFHVEPCNWPGTVLQEALDGLAVPDPVRPVIFQKRLPALWIDALYEPEVFAGTQAQFTLVYSNTGGFESAARIRNGFPDDAPYSASTPSADRWDPNGLWAEWDLGSLAENGRGTIDVVVDILPGLQPSTTVVITDAIYNHAGELADEVEIRYHVTGARGWLEGYVMDSETGDLLPPCTPPVVGILPGPIYPAVDPTTGYYGPVELVVGTYGLVASAPGYSTEGATVDIVQGVTTTQNFNLWRPVVVVTPTDFVSVTAYISQPVTVRMDIGNHGHEQMGFEILEQAQGFDLPWVSEDPISGTIPPLSETPVDVTFHCTEPGEYAGTLVVRHDDPCQEPVALPIRLHCREPKWDKWIDDQPWGPDIGYTVETSDTVGIVDVITAAPTEPFTLTERWNPQELALLGYAVEPEIPVDPVVGDGIIIWKVPGDHPEVITITKRFHVEPCTWESTILREELEGLDVPDPFRPVQFDKKQPVLGLSARYGPGVFTGKPAEFTLVYSNTGGFENDVVIRNGFPPEAPYASSVPPADRWDPAGRWAEWDIPDLPGGTLDTIDVVVDIVPGLVPSTTIVITDVIKNHAGVVVDEVVIAYHVEPPPGRWEKLIDDQPWGPDIGYTVETSDTVGIVDVIIAPPSAPFTLTERWNAQELVLLGYAVEPEIPVDPVVDDGIIIWRVPGDHPEVITITKRFHVEPCTWESTILLEELQGLDVKDPIRSVQFDKKLPALGLSARYGPGVFTGQPAQFTLVYSNTGGFENDVVIRNGFPPDAPYASSVPPADRWDADGLWAEWDIPDLPGGTLDTIDVVVDIVPGLVPSTTIVITDVIKNHAGVVVDEVVIAYHVEPPPGRWEKLIQDRPWTQGITFTVETSDTVGIVDVIIAPPSAPFTLTERWNAQELVLLGYAVEPEIPVDPVVDDGIVIWKVPGDHPEVITITKRFHVEPCTWESTILLEELQGLDVKDPIREVSFEKLAPLLWIDAEYNEGVSAGDLALFTLVYGNDGGNENGVLIRNLFPDEAPYVTSVPAADRADPAGLWAEWDIAELPGGSPGSIDVVVDIDAGLPISTWVPITDYIIDHTGEVADEVSIRFHVQEPPPGEWAKRVNGMPWQPEISFRVEASDTITVVDRIQADPGAPFILFENWVPGELRLVDYAVDPPFPTQVISDAGVFIWDVPINHPDVITLTKRFHVERSPWRETTLVEVLQGLKVEPSIRRVTFEKGYNIFLPILLKNYPLSSPVSMGPAPPAGTTPAGGTASDGQRQVWIDAAAQIAPGRSDRLCDVGSNDRER